MFVQKISMKKLILLASLLLIVACWLQAQSGQIIFEQRINLHKRLGEENAQMKAMLPEWQQWKTQLVFNDQQSLYQNYEDEEEDGSISASSGGMRIQLQRPQNIIFQDYGKMERIQQEEFMQKRYLITEPIPKSSWKITGESREIMGYLCQQALLLNDTSASGEPREVVAWFTLDIPLSAGPGAFSQLPGMILVVDIDNGTSTIEAKKIDLAAEITDKVLKAPAKGTPISREDFQKERDKAMQEMNHGSGGGGVRIRF